MKIFFKKILAYDLRPKNTDQFTYVNDILNQKIDPPTLHPAELKTSTSIVFYSPMRRSTECIERIPNVLYQPAEELREIPFDLKRFITAEEFEKDGSQTVRRAFKKAFKTNQLGINRDKLFEDIETFLKQVRKSKVKEATAISHSFKLKLFFAFLETKGAIAQDYELIDKYILEDQKTYDFGNGFTANI